MGRFHRRNNRGRGKQLLFQTTIFQEEIVETLETADAPNPIYGSGVDGSITLSGSASGTAAITGSGSSYTMTRDIFCRNLTIGSSVHLNTNGYRLFVQGTLTLSSGSRVGFTTGNATAGSIMQGGAIDTSVTHSLGGASATETATDPTTAEGGTIYYKQALQAYRGYSITAGSTSPTFLRGGAGGTAGVGGGVVIVVARYITQRSGNSKIAAPGTAGSGGGGGGVVIVISSGSALPTSVGTEVIGGTGCGSGTAIYLQA